jgi:hypothetical protein
VEVGARVLCPTSPLFNNSRILRTWRVPLVKGPWHAQNVGAPSSGKMGYEVHGKAQSSAGSAAIVDIGFLVQRTLNFPKMFRSFRQKQWSRLVQRVLNGLKGFREFIQKQFIDPWTNLFFAE